jgi:hypothetical protein
MIKVTAYEVGLKLEMRPASPKRDWMDEARSKNPYRCLPLNIANGYGWEIVNPSKFTLEWNGGKNPKDVVVKKQAGTIFPDNHFGEGTFTWHTGYLFRTEYPYALYVTGPPNFPKPNVIPLSGIVETYWTPFTFTMNWRFTQPGSVSFEPGDILCQIFPVNISLFDDVKPEIRHLSEDPEFEEKYWNWNISRVAFSSNPTRGDVWQKDYFQGKYAQLNEQTGCPFHVKRTPEEEEKNPHRTKPNVPEFVNLAEKPYTTPPKYEELLKKIREKKFETKPEAPEKNMNFNIKSTSENTLPDIAEKINTSNKLVLMYVMSNSTCEENDIKTNTQQDLEQKIKDSYLDKVDYHVLCISEHNMPFPKIQTDVLYYFAPKNQTPLFFRDRFQVLVDLDHDIETAIKMMNTGASYFEAKFDDKTKENILKTEAYLKEDTTKFPSSFKMARNLAKEMWKTGKNAAKGLPILVPADVGVSRFSTCEICEHLDSKDFRCTQCGCFMKTKTQLASASCPVGKWGEYTG